MEKFEKKLRSMDLSGRTPAVVVATGAMSPVHQGHKEMLRQAKDRLERAGFVVLAGWISPASDEAALARARKLDYPELPGSFRLRLAELATEEDDLLATSSWQVRFPEQYPTVEQVATNLQAALLSKYGETVQQHVRVFMACGSDMVRSHKCLLKEKGQGLVIVPRSRDDVFLEKPADLLYVAEFQEKSVVTLSGTQIKQALNEGDKAFIRMALPQAAADLLLGVPRTPADRTLLESLPARPLKQPEAEGAWPFDKFMSAFEKEVNGFRPFAVLVAGDAMNPPSRVHLLMLEKAKQRLERAGFVVVGGWLLPQSDNQVGREAKVANIPALSSAFRLHAANLTAVEDPMVSVSTWEAGLSGLPPERFEVLRALRHAMTSRFPLSLQHRSIRIFYVSLAGAPNKAAAKEGIISRGEMGIVFVPRDSDDVLLESTQQMVFAAEDPLPEEAEVAVLTAEKVTTSVRSRDMPTVIAALAPAAARFILSPTPAEREQFAADFEALGVTSPGEADLARARDRVKGMLRAWVGPAGALQNEELGRLFQFLDPSWNEEELHLLATGAAKGGAGGGGVLAEEFVDWVFATAGC